jgi:hypothetical protein
MRIVRVAVEAFVPLLVPPAALAVEPPVEPPVDPPVEPPVEPLTLLLPPELLLELLATPDAAIADEFIEVESSSVMAGGTTTANFPAVVRNARRSGPPLDVVFSVSMKVLLNALLSLCRQSPGFARQGLK